MAGVCSLLLLVAAWIGVARAASFNRTVIFLFKETLSGQDLFIRGGIDSAQRPGKITRLPLYDFLYYFILFSSLRLRKVLFRSCRFLVSGVVVHTFYSFLDSFVTLPIWIYYPSICLSVYLSIYLSVFSGCTQDAETDPCAIDIFTHSLGTISHYESYNSWRVGDTRLDWMGAQVGQGTYNGQAASGTPLAWTTNNPLSPAFQELNTLVYGYIVMHEVLYYSRYSFCISFV